MCQKYILVENEWISPDVEINSMDLYLIFRYFFPIQSPLPRLFGPPAYQISKIFPTNTYYLHPLPVYYEL